MGIDRRFLGIELETWDGTCGTLMFACGIPASRDIPGRSGKSAVSGVDLNIPDVAVVVDMHVPLFFVPWGNFISISPSRLPHLTYKDASQLLRQLSY